MREYSRWKTCARIKGDVFRYMKGEIQNTYSHSFHHTERVRRWIKQREKWKWKRRIKHYIRRSNHRMYIPKYILLDFLQYIEAERIQNITTKIIIEYGYMMNKKKSQVFGIIFEDYDFEIHKSIWEGVNGWNTDLIVQYRYKKENQSISEYDSYSSQKIYHPLMDAIMISIDDMVNRIFLTK